MTTVSSRWIDLTFAINGVKMNVTGRENLWAERPAVFIFNHRNNFDAFIVARLVEHGLHRRGQEGDGEQPALGRARASSPTSRSSTAPTPRPRSRHSAPVEEAAKKGLSILIAPEGTRLDTTTRSGRSRRARSAWPWRPEIPLVPIVIRNAELVAARKGNSLHPGTVDVAVLPPISVDDWTLDDLDDRIEGVRAAVPRHPPELARVKGEPATADHLRVSPE